MRTMGARRGEYVLIDHLEILFEGSGTSGERVTLGMTCQSSVARRTFPVGRAD